MKKFVKKKNENIQTPEVENSSKNPPPDIDLNKTVRKKSHNRRPPFNIVNTQQVISKRDNSHPKKKIQLIDKSEPPETTEKPMEKPTEAKPVQSKIKSKPKKKNETQPKKVENIPPPEVELPPAKERPKFIKKGSVSSAVPKVETPVNIDPEASENDKPKHPKSHKNQFIKKTDRKSDDIELKQRTEKQTEIVKKKDDGKKVNKGSTPQPNPQRQEHQTQKHHQKLNEKMLLTREQKNSQYFIDFYKKIEKHLNDEGILINHSKIIIAVSGGVDSCVLLDIFANLSSKYDLIIAVAHFNHNLRGKEAVADDEFVKNLAGNYHIPFHHSSGKVKLYSQKNSLSIEHSARILRYAFFEQIGKTMKINFLATAHTRDDSAETFLINLMRGSGLTGLSGIPVIRPFVKNITMIRPLLCFKKSELLEYAEQRKINWREDESNSLLFYTRNRVRHSLIPQIKEDFTPAVVEILNRTARLIHGADNFISNQVNGYIKSVVSEPSTGRIELLIPMLQTYDEFIQGEIIQQALTAYYKIQNVSLHTIDKILGLISSQTGSIIEMNKDITALRDRDSIIITKKAGRKRENLIIERIGEFRSGNNSLILSEVKKKDVKYISNPNIEYFDFDLLPFNLYWRSIKEGDTYQPLGMSGNMKVSDFLINEKIPLIDKNNIFILATKSEIVWICGMRISDKYKVTDGTERFLRAEFVKPKLY